MDNSSRLGRGYPSSECPGLDSFPLFLGVSKALLPQILPIGANPDLHQFSLSTRWEARSTNKTNGASLFDGVDNQVGLLPREMDCFLSVGVSALMSRLYPPHLKVSTYSSAHHISRSSRDSVGQPDTTMHRKSQSMTGF